jgi:hypothetical protein
MPFIDPGRESLTEPGFASFQTLQAAVSQRKPRGKTRLELSRCDLKSLSKSSPAPRRLRWSQGARDFIVSGRDDDMALSRWKVGKNVRRMFLLARDVGGILYFTRPRWMDACNRV